MAKRFTDTGKWRDEWFKTLNPYAKLVWIYICDDCDHAGIWTSDFEVMSIRLGFKVDEAKFKELLGEKVRKFDRCRYFIPSFFNFQYASSKEGFRAKQSALSSLQKYGLVDTQGTLKEEFMDTQGTLTEQSLDCLSISKSKGKSSSNTGSAEGDDWKPDLEAIYARYPLKKGKSPGLKKLAATIKTPSDEQDAHKALDAFLANHKRLGTEARFIPHFKTWAGSWRDCLDPDYGQAETFASSPQAEIWETTAKRVLDAVVKAGAGSSAHSERECLLGPEIHALAIKAGIQRIRDVKRDAFQLKVIGDMLRQASEALNVAV